MNAEPHGRARLLDAVLTDDDLAAWREALRSACLTRLAAVPSGRKLLLREVVDDADHVAFRERLRADLGTRLGRTPRRRHWATWAAAALLLAALGAWLWRAEPKTWRESEIAGPGVSAAPARRWLVRTRPLTPAVLSRSRLDPSRTTSARLDVVATRPLAARLRLTKDAPVFGPTASPAAPLERVDDAGLLALLPGRPSALVEIALGAKRLVLLDPADEAALLAPLPGDAPR